MKRTGYKSTPRVGTLLLTVILAGCAVGPDYQQPKEKAVTLSQPLDRALYSNERLQRDWWRQFQDPQLNRAIEQALSNNQDIQLADARLMASRAALDRRQLDRLPTIASSAAYTRSISQANAGQEGERNGSTQYSGTLDMQWELDLFGRLRRLSEAATARSQASADDLVQTQIVVASEVARHYFLMRGALQKMNIAREGLVNRQQAVRLVTAMVAAGRSHDDELASAQAELARVQASLAPITTEYYLARYRLAVLMGLRPNEVDEMLKATPLPTLVTRLPIGNLSELLRHRPDVASAERALAASTADVGVATADLYPRIDLGGFLGFVAIRGGDIPSSASRAFGIMPSINWPALHFASVKAQQREAQARQRGQEAQYKKVVLQAIEETEGALMRYSQSQQRLEALSEAVSYSRQAANTVESRYRAGEVPFLKYLAAQRIALSAEDGLVDADTDSFINIVGVYKSLGGGW